MIVEILSFLHNATTLLFGVYISAGFLGIKMTKKNVLALFIFSCVIGSVYISSYLLWGRAVTEQIYPLIIHLPLILFLTFYFKYKFALSSLSALTAYLCCQISNWVGIAVLNATRAEWAYYTARIITTVTVFIVLMRFVSDATAQLLQKPTKSIIILGLMPFVYYLFDYSAGVYTGLLYSGNKVVVEFLGFILCIFYILFIFLYFKEYEEKTEAQQCTRLMEMKRTQIEKEIQATRRSQQAVSILRHDMRHLLLNISTFIDNNELDKAQAYINEIIVTTDKTSMHKYCKNEIVNMILSSHESDFSGLGIDFKYSIQIPETLPFSDVDITSILSNAIENAIQAVTQLPEEKRTIKLDMYVNDGKLLISLKNPFAQKPKMIDGIPQASRQGHGIGTQSIRYVVEKLKGNCQFSLTDTMFILQIVL